MSKILITGGAGYIGSHVTKLLKKQGYEVVVYDNLSTGHTWAVKEGKLIKGDLLDFSLLDGIFEHHKIKAVMHFAACAIVSESLKNPHKYFLNNVGGTLNLLKAMVKHNVKTLIFSSTCALYGIPKKIPIPENHPQNPITPYGESKLMIEKILNWYSKAGDLQYVSLRYFNAAGADVEGEIGEVHHPETHLIPNVLLTAIGKKPYVEIYGTSYSTPDGTCIRDYIHVLDLAEAHLLALQFLYERKKSEVFNLGNGKGYSVREVIKTAEKITRKKIPVVELEKREGDPPVLIASSEKIQKVLGWKPQHPSLEEIISSAWEWTQKAIKNSLL
jgi:UDP-glucose 4-epimerase